jgi:hypothetical protein
MRHGGITGFEVKIGRDGGIFKPGTGPSCINWFFYIFIALGIKMQTNII